MSDKPTGEPATTTPQTARVEVIQQGVRIGNHICNAGHIIESLPMADAEFRAKQGEIVIISLNP